MDLTVRLETDGEPVESFSAADNPDGMLSLRLTYNNREQESGPASGRYTAKAWHEDGFVYHWNPWRVKAYPGYTGSWRQRRLNTGDNRPWKPGLHTAALFDEQGVKVAETTWTVTP